jgi:hypothetical protein
MCELDAVLRRSAKGKQPGWDGVPYEVLQRLGPLMKARLLTALNGLWLADTTVPSWKETIGVPLPKKDAPQGPDDFRQVSLIVTMGKVMEGLVHLRLQHLLDGPHKKLSPMQLGFRHHTSAMQQVVRLVQATHNAWKRKWDVVCVTLDIEKAFDTMWPEGVVCKLGRKGVKGRILRWILNYLRGRTTRARVGDVVGPPASIDLGIQQGGILGPLLFDVIMDDIPIPLHSGGLFADDAGVWMAVPRDNGTHSNSSSNSSSSNNNSNNNYHYHYHYHYSSNHYHYSNKHVWMRWRVCKPSLTMCMSGVECGD